MNWLKKIISRFSQQGLAVTGLAYFRDIGKGGVRTVTVTSLDGEVRPVALNEDYQGYIRAITPAQYRQREELFCGQWIYDVEQDVAVVMWLERKQNPNGVLDAIQQALYDQQVLTTTFDKQVILNEEGLPENDFLMLKVTARISSTYAGSKCPPDVCAVYYDPCFEVPSRPEPTPIDNECTLQVSGGGGEECCDYRVENVPPLTSSCVRIIFPEEFDYSPDAENNQGFLLQVLLEVINTDEIPVINHTYFNIYYSTDVLDTPTISQILSDISENFDDYGGRYVLRIGSNWFEICDTENKPLGSIYGTVFGYFPNETEYNVSFITTTPFVTVQGEVTSSYDYILGINEVLTHTFQVLINGEWTTIPSEQIVDGTWTSLNDCRQVTDWRIIDSEENVIASGEVTRTNCTGGTTEETKTICEWLQEHQEAIEAIEPFDCSELEDCQIIQDIQGTLAEKANISDLAQVAFSGDYNDLTNLPTIPPAQVNSDWNAVSGVAEILNKPTIPTLTSQLTNDSNYQTLADVQALFPQVVAHFSGNASHTGDTLETVVQVITIPPDKWMNMYKYMMTWYATRSGATVNIRIYLNTAATLDGNEVLLAQSQQAANSLQFQRNIWKNGNNFFVSNTLTGVTDIITTPSNVTVTKNTTVTTYLIVTIQLSVNSGIGALLKLQFGP